MFKRYLLLMALLIPLASYAQKSRAYSPVPVLNQLHAFQLQHGFERYCEGFGVTKFDDDSALAAGWSRDPQFLKALYPFAQATASGAFYAIWQMKPGDSLSNSPIVLFGDEGGEHVVAQNVEELLSLVMLDTEPEIDDDLAAFTRPSNGYTISPAHREYTGWVAHSFPRVDPDDHEIIVERAQKRYGPAFKKWKKKYVKRKK
jgi:hypothetical protein